MEVVTSVIAELNSTVAIINRRAIGDFLDGLVAIESVLKASIPILNGGVI